MRKDEEVTPDTRADASGEIDPQRDRVLAKKRNRPDTSLQCARAGMRICSAKLFDQRRQVTVQFQRC